MAKNKSGTYTKRTVRTMIRLGHVPGSKSKKNKPLRPGHNGSTYVPSSYRIPD